MTSPSRHVTALVISVLAFAAAVAIVLISLSVATGATPEPGVDPTSYSTEYQDMGVYAITAVLPFVLGIAALYSVGFALLSTIGVFVVEWWSILEGNDRLTRAGWGDGLEALAFLLPIGEVVLTLFLVLIGFFIGRGRRQALRLQDQYTTTLSPTTT